MITRFYASNGQKVSKRQAITVYKCPKSLILADLGGFINQNPLLLSIKKLSKEKIRLTIG